MIEPLYQEVLQTFLAGQYEAGKSSLLRALTVAREGKDPGMAGAVLALGARWHGCQGEWDLAASMAIEARWAFEEQLATSAAVWIAAFTGLAQVQLGQTQKGRTLLESSVIRLEDGEPARLVDGRCWLAQALLLLDERDTARGYLQELALNVRPDGREALYRQGIVGLLLASLEADAQQWASVGRSATIASKCFEELGHIPYWVSANALIGLQHVGLGEWTEAKQSFDVTVPLLQDTRHVVVDVNQVLKVAAEVDRRIQGSVQADSVAV